MFDELVRRRQERVPVSELAKWIHGTGQTSKDDFTPYQDMVMDSSIKNAAEDMDQALASLKICDPAIGSGAFPVGILLEVVRLRRALQAQFHLKPQSSYELKRETILNSIYGVDIEPSAVDVAKLRLWLSLVVDEESFDDIKPLPNLDYKIMVGNSLSVDAVQYDLFDRYVRPRIASLKQAFFSVTDPQEKKKMRAEIKVLAQDLKSGDIFDWRADFCEAFEGENGGFDLVIANPPYVRQERFKEQKKRLKECFPAFFESTADLYTYFYFLALGHLLKPHGHACFIAPNKFFKAKYGKKLRRFLADATPAGKKYDKNFKGARLKKIIDFNDLPIFKATTYPSIILAEVAETNTGHQFPAASINDINTLPNLWESIEKKSVRIDVNNLNSQEPWSLEDPKTEAILRKLKNKYRTLGEMTEHKIYYGIKTGFNDAFVITGATRQKLVGEDPNCAEVIQPWLRGKDIKKWRAEPSGLHLINIQSSSGYPWPWATYDKEKAEVIFKETYPTIYRHLHSNPQWRKTLITRADQGLYFWELRSCAYTANFLSSKIIYPDISQSMRACFDRNGSFVGNTGYILIAENYHKILAILHSHVFHFFAQNYFASIQGKSLRFIAQYMEPFPIPESNIHVDQQISMIVDDILSRKVKDPAANVERLENDLNQIVYHLYQLTPDDISLIENSISTEKHNDIVEVENIQKVIGLEAELDITTLQYFKSVFEGNPRTTLAYHLIANIMNHSPGLEEVTYRNWATWATSPPEMFAELLVDNELEDFKKSLIANGMPHAGLNHEKWDAAMVFDFLKRSGVSIDELTGLCTPSLDFAFSHEFPHIDKLVDCLKKMDEAYQSHAKAAIAEKTKSEPTAHHDKAHDIRVSVDTKLQEAVVLN